MEGLDRLLDNVHADSWSDVNDESEYLFEDERADPLERFESYVDYCFDTYSVVSDNLDREQIQPCIADWGRRRGMCRYNARMSKRVFDRQVRKQYECTVNGNYAIFVATALVGVGAEDDNGCGWKATARHELGHAIDYEQRGTSDHSRKFKHVMAQFGEVENDGQHAHGYYPRNHR